VVRRLEDLIEYLERRRERREWWRDIVVGEILSEQLAEKVAEKILAKLPKPAKERAPTPHLFMREPHKMFVTARTIIIRSDTHGYIEEFGFQTTNKNFKLYVKRDGEYLVPGRTYDTLDAYSEQIGWLMATVDESGLYNVGIGGFEWYREFEIAVEPTSSPLILYNVFWRYYEF